MDGSALYVSMSMEFPLVNVVFCQQKKPVESEASAPSNSLDQGATGGGTVGLVKGQSQPTEATSKQNVRETDPAATGPKFPRRGDVYVQSNESEDE